MRYFIETTNKRGTIGRVYIHEEGFFEDDKEIEVLAENVTNESEIISKSDLIEIGDEDYNKILEENDLGITTRSEEILNNLK